MTYRLPPLVAMRAFEAAARHLSFKKAADELHVTPAAVSQQIKALESYLGVLLFHRLTRALEITPHGRSMLPKVREGFECFASAVAEVAHDGEGSLNVTAPPSFATRWLVPRLARFSAAYPEVVLRLASSGNTVDRRGDARTLDESSPDVRDPNSQIAIRFGIGNYPGFQVDRILRPAWGPVCSPGLPSPTKPLVTPADLCHHVLIHDETINDQERQPGWREWLDQAGVSNIDATRGPRFSNSVLAVEAALDGQGVALTFRQLVETDIAAGRLIVPFEQSVVSPYAYYLVVRKAIAARPAVTAFREWILAEMLKAG